MNAWPRRYATVQRFRLGYYAPARELDGWREFHHNRAMGEGATHSRNKLLVALLALGAAVAVTAAAIWYFTCPCTRVPGGYLLGEEVASKVDDWSFANKARLCQIEVGGWLRHSVNLNCMAVDGELYLSCAACDGKRWSTLALRNPNGRIRIEGRVYPVTLVRVTDPATLDAAWHARAAKFGRTDSRPRAEGWWSFHLESR